MIVKRVPKNQLVIERVAVVPRSSSFAYSVHMPDEGFKEFTQVECCKLTLSDIFGNLAAYAIGFPKGWLDAQALWLKFSQNIKTCLKGVSSVSPADKLTILRKNEKEFDIVLPRLGFISSEEIVEIEVSDVVSTLIQDDKEKLRKFLQVNAPTIYSQYAPLALLEGGCV